MPDLKPLELRIDLVAPQSPGHIPKPKGVTVEQFFTRAFDGPLKEPIITFIVILAPAAYDLGVNVLGAYVYDQIKAWRSRRVRVNDREPKDDEELRRIIAEEIQIGKND